MIVSDYLLCEKSVQWEYVKQLGIKQVVIRLPEDGRFDVTNQGDWEGIHNRFTAEGLTPAVIEPMPNSLHEHIKLGDEKRGECIEKVIKMLPIMDSLNISIICFNFMAHIGWYRSESNIKERGGALVTGFNINDFTSDDEFVITENQLWANLEYFLKAVVPHAERFNIRLALHPDDPPVERLGGVSRILTSYAHIDRALKLCPSKRLGVTMCQATYAAMGEDLARVIPELAKNNKIFFVHFRDIRGDKYHFHETFHDNGQTDMAKMIRLYREHGVNVPIRVDHVPTMAGESNDAPGYAALGRLYAIGYLKGLLDGVGEG